jgi:hypothetical protein
MNRTACDNSCGTDIVPGTSDPSKCSNTREGLVIFRDKLAMTCRRTCCACFWATHRTTITEELHDLNSCKNCQSTVLKGFPNLASEQFTYNGNGLKNCNICHRPKVLHHEKSLFCFGSGISQNDRALTYREDGFGACLSCGKSYDGHYGQYSFCICRFRAHRGQSTCVICDKESEDHYGEEQLCSLTFKDVGSGKCSWCGKFKQYHDGPTLTCRLTYLGDEILPCRLCDKEWGEHYGELLFCFLSYQGDGTVNCLICDHPKKLHRGASMLCIPSYRGNGKSRCLVCRQPKKIHRGTANLCFPDDDDDGGGGYSSTGSDGGRSSRSRASRRGTPRGGRRASSPTPTSFGQRCDVCSAAVVPGTSDLHACAAPWHESFGESAGMLGCCACLWASQGIRLDAPYFGSRACAHCRRAAALGFPSLGAAAAAACAAAAAPGARVRLGGLLRRPELNGRTATVRRLLDNGRAELDLDGTDAPLSIALANMVLLDIDGGGREGGGGYGSGWEGDAGRDESAARWVAPPPRRESTVVFLN